VSRLLCALLGHRPMAGISRDYSFCFWCTRCHCVVPGPLAVRR
jgi:hypothetical protein